MKESAIEQRTAKRSEYWREQIARQENSGLSVQRFCQEQGVAEQSFYVWRKRLREQQQPVRFALVQTASAEQQCDAEVGLELLLARGERLRIGAGVDPIVLRIVLEVLRA